MFKVNNKDTRKTPLEHTWNFEHISHLVLVFLLLTFNMYVLAGSELPNENLHYITFAQKESHWLLSIAVLALKKDLAGHSHLDTIVSAYSVKR